MAQYLCMALSLQKKFSQGLEAELMFTYQEWLSLGQDSRNTTENAALQNRLGQYWQRTTVLKHRWPQLRRSKNQEPDLHTLSSLIFPQGAEKNCWSQNSEHPEAAPAPWSIWFWLRFFLFWHYYCMPWLLGARGLACYLPVIDQVQWIH